jgi:zinc protease
LDKKLPFFRYDKKRRENARMTLRLFCTLAAVAAAGASASIGAQAPPASEGASPVRLTVPSTEFTLGNGLHVILHQDKTVPVASVNVWYHVGSGREKPGRTGFAHLFEHVMFEGSQHVPEGAFDSLLEAAGGDNNGSTTEDRTNYVIDVPSNALELALFLESDRMGFLLPTLTQEKLDGQRDVVKNEKRQRIDNAPYGQAMIELGAMLYPKGHPYSWPVIGSMEDLSAARLEDVVEFFKTYYTPNNASLVVGGDIDIEATRKLVEKWFGGIPRGGDVPPLLAPPATLPEVKRKTITDRVQLPRLYLAWHTPATYAPGDAALDVISSLLTGGKNSRLYRRLVYEMQIAQDVTAAQQSQALSSIFLVVATARPGQSLEKIQAVIDEEIEKLKQAPPDEREMTRTFNQFEASFFRRMERTGGFGGKADQLNAYYFATGMPDFFEEDLSRYRAISPNDIQSAANRFLPKDRRVELIVTGEKK